MGLEKLLSRVLVIGSLSLGSYNCDSASPDSCVKDTDCKGERVCISGVCQQQGSYGGSDASGQNNTNNASPLCNNYLELVNYCCKREGPGWGDECKKSQSSIVQSCESHLKDPYAKKELNHMLKQYNSSKCCYFSSSDEKCN